MAKSLRFRSLLLNPFPFSSYSYSQVSIKSFHQYIDQQNYSISSIIRNKALQLLNSCKTSPHFFQIHAHLITSGLFQDPSFSGRLLKLSTHLSDDLYYTIFIFNCIDFPDAFCVNTVIKNYSSSNYHKESVCFYIQMLGESSFLPNSFTFPPLISACAKLRCLSLGQMCHVHALKFGVDNVLPVQNSLIHFYSCCGLMETAHKLFDEMPIKDFVTWNTIIDGLARVFEMDLAHKLFDAMPSKNVVTWNVMITGYLNFRSPGNALKLFREMNDMGVVWNHTTAVTVIAASGKSNRLKEGKSVHGFIIKMFLKPNLIIDTTLVDMYSKCGRLDLARVIFDRMPNKNLVSWNTMILGLCIHGDPKDGLNLYTEMVDKCEQRNQDTTCVPDEITFIGILCACAREGMLTMGKYYFSQMIDVFHLKPNFAHYWCMANLMANVGLTQEALDILRNTWRDEDVSPESSLWAGLFGSCRFKGDVIFGEQIAKELIEQDPENFSHYNLLVNVYAAGGKWEEVAKVKDIMKERGIKRVPFCNLKDLKEIVDSVNVGSKLTKDLQLSLSLLD